MVHVHDLVDFVSDEAGIAGKYAALTAQGKMPVQRDDVAVNAGDGVRTCVPQHICRGGQGETVRLFMRVRRPMRKVRLEIRDSEVVLLSKALPVAKPSEMIAVDLPAAKVEAMHGSLEVTVREEV